MTDASRRSLLLGLVGLGLFHSFSSEAGFFSSHTVWTKDDVLKSVFQSWCSTYGSTPSAFIDTSGCLALDESSLKALIRDEFLTGRVATYDGLLISKTEFALWAWLGQGTC